MKNNFTMNPATTKRAPRQLPPHREQEILDAAQCLFFEKGVAATTTDEIAQQAGISKATLYRRYSSKQDIFEKVILKCVHNLAHELGSVQLDPKHPKQSLRQAASRIRQIMVQPNYVDLMRQMIAEAHTQPALSRQAQQHMIAAITPRFTRFFDQLISEGKMVHPHPEQAAITFALMAGGGFRPLLNARFSEQEEHDRLNADLYLFLKGCEINN